MSDDMSRHGGRCLCGAVRYVATGAPLWVAHCHCESCRRATAAPLATYAGYRRDRFAYEAGTPASYRSSPGVTRSFCGRCGTPLTYEAEHYPDEVHIFVCTFDQPEAFRPQVHVYVDEQLPWLRLADGLPRYHATARDAEPIP